MIDGVTCTARYFIFCVVLLFCSKEHWNVSSKNTLTCVADTFLKKSELTAADLPATQKLAKSIGARIALVVPPTVVEDYFLVQAADS